MDIVVGYDGSDAARHALERAAAIAGPDDRVTVVSVYELRAEPVLTEGAQIDPSQWLRTRENAAEALALLAERGVTAETVVGQGDPADAILKAAQERGAGLIVVGHKGHSRLHLLLGSVSHKVAHRAECDVLIVR